MRETSLSCPLKKAIAGIADKWKVLLILELSSGTLRFGEIIRRLEGSSAKVISRQLQELEADGLVHRKSYAVIPPRVEYSLTSAGQSLLPIFASLHDWVVAHPEVINRVPVNGTREALELANVSGHRGA